MTHFLRSDEARAELQLSPKVEQAKAAAENRRRLSEPMRLPGQAPPWYRAPIATRTPTVIIMNGPERFSARPPRP
jgi:hypothetical protein